MFSALLFKNGNQSRGSRNRLNRPHRRRHTLHHCVFPEDCRPFGKVPPIPAVLGVVVGDSRIEREFFCCLVIHVDCKSVNVGIIFSGVTYRAKLARRDVVRSAMVPADTHLVFCLLLVEGVGHGHV